MAIHISHSPSETEALGESWGRAAVSGSVIGLSGDLGAGKTQLVKGLARGLGIVQRVHSPTFALVNVYSGGRLTLFHLDLYRLETPEQITASGLEEYLHPTGVTVIEWAERLFGGQQAEGNRQNEGAPVPAFHSSFVLDPSRFTFHGSRSFRWVEIETLTDSDRRLSYEDLGA